VSLKRTAPPFDAKVFLTKVGQGRTILNYRKNQKLFSQGDPADSVFYIQDGRVKITVVSEHGKEAVVALLGKDEFCGEGCLAGRGLRISTASAITDCEIMRLEKTAIVRALHDEPAFAEMFLEHLLLRTIRVEEDLVDQLFNSSEKRLARASHPREFWQGGKAGTGHCQGEPGDTGRDDRNDPLARKFLHE